MASMKSGLPNIFATFSGIFPDRKTRTGDSWEWSPNRDILKRNSLTYTYNGIRRHRGLALARIDVAPSLDKFQTQGDGPDRKTLQRTQRGVTWFDPVAGVLQEAVSHFVIENKRPGDGNNADTLRMEMTARWMLI